MSGRAEWESRYDGLKAGALRPASRFIAEIAPLLRPGLALEVACGDGRNALHLAQRGWRVEVIDFAHGSLAKLLAAARREHLAVGAVQADLEEFPLPRGRYDMVVNVRYLQRDLFPALKDSVRPGGVVAFETFIRDQQQLGHPRNPAFLLERGELAERFADFDLVKFEEGRFETESGAAFLARALARRR